MKSLCSFSTLAALILFFLPWVDVKCSGQSLMTQTGAQAAYGGMSPAEGAEEMKSESKNDSIGTAWFVGLAFLLTVAAFFSAVSSTGESSNTPGMLAGIALALVVIQMMTGFPVEEKIEESNGYSSLFGGMMKSASYDNESSDPNDILAAQALSSMDMSAKTEYMPPLYFTLAALGLAAFSGFAANGSSSKSRARSYHMPPDHAGYPASEPSTPSRAFPESLPTSPPLLDPPSGEAPVSPLAAAPQDAPLASLDSSSTTVATADTPDPVSPFAAAPSSPAPAAPEGSPFASVQTGTPESNGMPG